MRVDDVACNIYPARRIGAEREGPEEVPQGRVVQAEPMKAMLKPPGTKRLIL